MIDIKIAIGPTVKDFGGVPQHIWNIKHHSEYSDNIDVILYPKISPRSVPFLSGLLEKKCIKYADPNIIFRSKFILPKYDIVHLHGHPYFPEFYIRPTNKRAKYIHTVHRIYTKEDISSYQSWKVLQWLNEQMLDSCSKSNVVICVSKWLKKVLYEKHNIDSIYIPNGVDVSKFSKSNGELFKQKYGINDEFYLFVGRLHPYKRPELLIYLAQKIPDKKFVMIGPGCTYDGIKNYFGQKIPDNIICLGEISDEDVSQAFSACRVFILPSKDDTFPTVVLEAMANKKVVLASNSGGPKEIVRNGIDGFLFEPDNKEDLYQNALKAWDKPNYGMNGYKRVKKEFDWKVVTNKIDNVYKELV